MFTTIIFYLVTSLFSPTAAHDFILPQCLAGCEKERHACYENEEPCQALYRRCVNECRSRY